MQAQILNLNTTIILDRQEARRIVNEFSELDQIEARQIRFLLHNLQDYHSLQTEMNEILYAKFQFTIKWRDT